MLSPNKLYAAVAGCLIGLPALAATVSQDEIEAANVMLGSPIVVTATRTEQNSFDLPVSIDVVAGETVQEGRLQANVSESLARVPGVVGLFRGHSAQDVQISTRGFGARSAFGIRGVRLYADGIPLTMPDGQGQAGTIDLGSARSIEVMRGPFSALYGNSSGGVMQVFTEDGPQDPTITGAFTAGSYNTRREAVKFGGTSGGINYLLNDSHLESDGYRDHSAVRRDLFNAKLGVNLGDSTHLTLLATHFDQPLGLDPQGLSITDLKKNPEMVTTKTNTFNTRVERSQDQIGVKLDHVFDSDNTASLMVYGGQRDNLQYQSVGANVYPSNPATLNANGATPSTLSTGLGLTLKPASAYYYSGNTANGNTGGVVAISRDFWGTDLRYTHKGTLAQGPYSVTLGMNFDTMTDARTGYDNFLFNRGITPSNNNSSRTYQCGTQVTCGVQGLLRRDEDNTAWNFDQYAQAEWSPTSRWSVVGGVRHNDVHLKSEDHFIRGTQNGDDSGGASFAKTTPVIGTVFKVNDMVNLYANAGKGFETPSLVEVAYLPGGSGGFNGALKPATSNNYEIGTKAFIGENTRATLAIFQTDTSNEIVVADNTNGRSSYQNAGGTLRKGTELTIDSAFGNGFAVFASYAYLDATYSDAFCSGSTRATKALCTATNSFTNKPYGSWVTAGKAIPGTYRQMAYAEVSWKYAPIGFSTALEGRTMSKVYVTDSSTESAGGYGIASWRGGFSQHIDHWRMAEFVRVENLFGKDYVGSVKVNDSSSQFYEPANGRNWLLGINASYQF